MQTQVYFRIKSFLNDLRNLAVKHAETARAKSQKARKASPLYPCITHTGRRKSSFGRYTENRMIQLLPNCDGLDA